MGESMQGQCFQCGANFVGQHVCPRANTSVLSPSRNDVRGATVLGLTWEQLNGAYRQKEREIEALQAERRKLLTALAALQHCPHACLPPCPHSRKYDEATNFLEALPSGEAES